MALTKAELVESLSEKGHKRKESIQLVESLLEIIKNSLESGEDVLISGFGKFSIKGKNSRRGRNPQSGEDLTLAKRRIVTFRYSAVLRDKINDNS